jgi:hypothetical protein
MTSSSSLVMPSIFFVGLKLTYEFTSLEEPIDDSDLLTDAVFSCRRTQLYRI